jgi:DNA topoisomerase-2
LYDPSADKIVPKTVAVIPALCKLFDEILVNAADNKQRDASTSRIDVRINAEDASISIMNNGKGIPVRMHKDAKMWVPELVLGNLLTGSNFDDGTRIYMHTYIHACIHICIDIDTYTHTHIHKYIYT